MNTSLVALYCTSANVSRHEVTRTYWKIFEDAQSSAPAVAAVFIVFFLIASVWNAFIVCTIIRKRLLRTPTHILILSLAVNDFLVSILVMPFTIVSTITLEFTFGDSDYARCQVCKMGVIFTLLSGVSLHTIALLSLDRFLFIYWPMKYKRYITRGRMLVVVIFIWGLCTVMAVPPLFAFGTVGYTASFGACVVIFHGETHVTQNFYYVLLFLLESLIPITVIIVSNIALLHTTRKQIGHLWRARKKMYSVSKEKDVTEVVHELRKEHNKHQLQLFKVFGAIFLANIITWSPVVALAVGAPAINFETIPSAALTFVYTTYISHSVIHPILESWFISELREATKTVLCYCCRKRDRVQGALHMTGSRDIDGESSKECKDSSTNTPNQTNMADSSGSVGSTQRCQCWGEAGPQGRSRRCKVWVLRMLPAWLLRGRTSTAGNVGQQNGEVGVV